MDSYEKAVSIWRQKHIRNDAELAEALNGHSIAFAYHSGRIENENITYNDTREIFEHDGVTSYTGDLKTLFEIRNAKEANELLLLSFEKRSPIDEGLVKDFQYRLPQNTYDPRRWRLGERPGEYKKHDHPPIIIHEEDRKEYYGALEAWDERQELEPLIHFLKEQTVKTWAKQMGR